MASMRYLTCCCLIFLIIMASSIDNSDSALRSISIGAIFEPYPSQEESAFRYGIRRMNELYNGTTQFLLYNDVVATTTRNSFILTRSLCDLVQDDVVAIYANPSDHATHAVISSFASSFGVPFLSASYLQYNTSMDDFTVYIKPKLSDTLIKLVEENAWTRFTYMHDDDESRARVEDITHSAASQKWDIKIRTGSSNSAMLYRATADMRLNEEYNIIIDMSYNNTEAFLNTMYHRQMLVATTNITIVNPMMALGDISRYYFGQVNMIYVQVINAAKPEFVEFKNAWHSSATNMLPMTGYSITDISPAVAYDAAVVLYMAVRATMETVGFQNSQRLSMDQSCGNDIRQSELGKLMLDKMIDVQHDGLTGQIQFDEYGFRSNYVVSLMRNVSYHNKPTLVGEWRDGQLNATGLLTGDGEHLIIISILEEPFFMKKKPDGDEVFEGNAQWEGYCVDLITAIADKLKFTYTLRPVVDGEYGSDMGGGYYNGMVGEIINETAHLAVAPLTINMDRQKVISFSKPFMGLGISIMISKPNKLQPSAFSFLQPLHLDVWLYIGLSYLGVSVGLYLVCRFNPGEWRPAPHFVEKGAEGEPQENVFTFYNTIWFVAGALMQQGADISPRTLSGRVIGAAWWFFVLIIIASYTANLAAFLTVEKMDIPIDSAEALAGQVEIEYGSRGSGTTKTYIENSPNEVHQKMWEFMRTHDVFVASNEEGIARVRNLSGKYAYLIESTMNEYQSQRLPCDTMKVGENLDSKGYGIAAKLNSELIEQITVVILELQEDNTLSQLKEKWWYEKGECDSEFSSTSTGAPAALGPSSLVGIFYILMSGLALAMLAAIAEFVFKAWLQAQRTRVC